MKFLVMITRSFFLSMVYFTLTWIGGITKYYSGYQIEENKMGGACSKYGGKERCIQDFGRET
jgi:uncharacterized membrane protein